VAVYNLQNKITTTENIDDIIKEFDVCIPNNINNDNKNLIQAFYNSKLFLSVIKCLMTCNDKHALKLLTLIEKLLKYSKQMAKYLAKNIDLINLIMKFMLKKVISDHDKF